MDRSRLIENGPTASLRRSLAVILGVSASARARIVGTGQCAAATKDPDQFLDRIWKVDEPDVDALPMRWLPQLDSGDRRAHAAGAIALVVALNQPFYPLYLYAVAGAATWPAWLVLLTTPFYAVIPIVLRTHDRLGRAMLPVVGVANTLIATKVLGPSSGVEMFYLPCILMAIAVTKAEETWAAAALVALIALAYLVGGPWLGPPVAIVSASESAALVKLHAISVGGLLGVCGYVLRPIRQAAVAADEGRGRPT